MKTTHTLTLADAEFLLDQSQKYAVEHSFNVSIAVVDVTGSLLTMKRMDGAAPISATICQEKAKCSALSTKPSKVFEDMIKNGRNGFLSISNFVGLLEGGLPIVYEGQVVGAVGVSGVQSHQDAEIAQHAIDKFLAQAG
ncbi:heme-binding protein [Acinetobacter portensis]|uniref:Heme-binding protein n=2 Tax=Acinetobacter TaxID=469 RepID=A0ABU5GIM1_9GAMM|nr:MULTISPECIES: heme-binding protein [Acinetobacter]MCK7609944.1 heme-binding protein [Acinetobacter portensis]MCK7640719.1 heme-binding protein [Acinetobacter portensis]MDY6460251.1 heme-binding protein [Acinetobacter faecalis]MDY6484268.1 heme-binding protein [Acinetobacter faecalis]MDY6489254.1 heme-binding protein [Acinetobacter faecalis]